MRSVFWKLLKFGIALALVIPLSIIVLATALGLFAALFGLAVFVLRIAIVGLIAWGVYRLGKALFGGSREQRRVDEARQLVPIHDRYYEEAKRELDRELGHI